MIATRGLGYGFGALPTFGLASGIVSAAPTGSKGRRVGRWVISAPSIENPVGEWIRQREDEEILLLG